MREVISIQVGQYGNKAGHHFWKQLFAEHGLDPTGAFTGPAPDTQLARIASYFAEAPRKSGDPSFSPRALCVDLDPGAIDCARATDIGGSFRPENFIAGEYSTASCFAEGFWGRGNDLIGPIMETLRRETERCDSLQGFQIIHALGGGTGSGLGAKILDSISEEYYDKVRITFSLFPNSSFGYTSVVEPYNAVLALQHLIDIGSSSVCADEGAIWRRARETPSQDRFDELMAGMMSDVTACSRFPSKISGDLHKLETSLIYFPRMHFFIPAHTSTHSPSAFPYTNHALPILVQQLFDPRNHLATCNPRNGRYGAVAPFFRGEINVYELEEQLVKFQENNSANFIEWMPNNITCFVTNSPKSSPTLSPTPLSHLFATPSYPSPSLSPSSLYPSPSLPHISATYLGNTSAITELFKPILSDFDAIFRRKAFLNPFTHYGGMDEMEFVEAQANLQDLISEYIEYANPTIYDEENI
eukprot:Phypoly_transcript_05022.p1 GENE.Phypoly_transcript_05022~~Phypoly_transcript_05022.p1  ORF type:complete len:472 (-),score=101.14 Phypoly_transcript_05022:555-1970(-)